LTSHFTVEASTKAASARRAGTGPPDRYRSLQARLAAAPAERDAAIAERDAALSQDDRLRRLLHQLQRMQFGRHSEKLDLNRLASAQKFLSTHAAVYNTFNVQRQGKRIFAA
jgi:hypothetical protein